MALSPAYDRETSHSHISESAPLVRTPGCPLSAQRGGRVARGINILLKRGRSVNGKPSYRQNPFARLGA